MTFWLLVQASVVQKVDITTDLQWITQLVFVIHTVLFRDSDLSMDSAIQLLNNRAML